jgi:hypothetical protein
MAARSAIAAAPAETESARLRRTIVLIEFSRRFQKTGPPGPIGRASPEKAGDPQKSPETGCLEPAALAKPS